MTTIIGGLRSRLVRDSFEQMIKLGLADLGWFDATVHDDPPGTRKHLKLHFVDRPVDANDTIVEFNSIAITADDANDMPAEMGSLLTEDTRHFEVDVYAEDDVIGVHLKDDIRDIIRGKMPSIGRDAPILRVFDFRLATPAEVFYCEIERVQADRAHGFTRLWQQHWWSVRCEVIDTYGDELYPELGI